MKKKSLSKRWTEKNYILFLLAVLVSLIIWVYMSFSSPNTNTTFTLSNIPINIELSQDARDKDLKVFPYSELKADVTLSGTRTVLGLVDGDDIEVTAATGSINSVGEYTLPITANKRSTLGNFTVAGCSKSSIQVWVDYNREKTFTIEKEGIIFDVADGYYGSVTLPNESIKISGPQTMVLKISQVKAVAKVQDKLKESREVNADIVLYDESGKESSPELLDLDTTVTAKIDVLKEKEVKVEPTFKNKPEGLEFSESNLTVVPSIMLIAGPDDVLKELDSVKLEPKDFATLKNEKYTFEQLAIVIPENCTSISGDTEAEVVLDLSAMTSKTITVDKITVEGLPSEYSSTVTTKSLPVVVYGTKAEIDKLTASQITAVVEIPKSSVSTGSTQKPVTFRFSDAKTCWAYGTYQANVTITKK